jgi:hypothetical protein
MMMKRLRNSIILALLPFPLLACSGGAGDGAGFSIRAVSRATGSSGSSLGVADEGGTSFGLGSALLHLRHIQLDLPRGMTCAEVEDGLAGATCRSDEKIHIDGPMAVDLVTGAVVPDLGAVVIPAGTYRRIDFRVDDGDPAEGLIEPGSALDDYSFVVEAGFVHEGEAVTLKMSLRFNEDIRIERSGGVTVAPGDDLIATFVVDDWLAGVDIAGCLEDGALAVEDGVVVIDDRAGSACGGVENTIKDNMKNSGELD